MFNYTIVDDVCYKTLQFKVNQMCANGFIPKGGVTIDHEVVQGTQVSKLYLQSMYKPLDENIKEQS